MFSFLVIRLRSLSLLLVFFFSSRRRHTRCSRDWSSDVCSSDLSRPRRPILPALACVAALAALLVGCQIVRQSPGKTASPSPSSGKPSTGHTGALPRSEERRVGKECRGRWWAGQVKGKNRDSDGW